jgi:DNA-binding GntR family transcriptional regulator
MPSSSDRSTAGIATLPRPSAYQQVVEAILSGHLAPGSKIDLAQLMRRYFISTSDLREAIIRLSSDGLALLDGPAALRITPVSVADLEELTTTRIFIESETVALSVRAGGTAWEAELAASYTDLADFPTDSRAAGEAWEQRNHRFHAALIAACPLRRLKDFSELLSRQHERYRRLLAGRRAVSPDIQREHQELFAAAQAHDGERAGRLLGEHIRRSAETLADGIADGSWFGTPLL